MSVTALSSVTTRTSSGDVWAVVASVRSPQGYPVDSAPTITIKPPAGPDVTVVAETVTTGVYRGSYQPVAGGRYVARVDAGDYGVELFTTFVEGGAAYPDVSALNDYLGEHSWTDDELADALDAEGGAQRDRCRVPAAYPAALRQALLRRAQRNLFLRRLPIGMPQGDSESGPQILPANDPEVRRLEGPYRRRPVR